VKKYSTLILYLVAFLFSMGAIQAQTPSDAIMMNKRELCIALTYDYGTWDRYWEGSYLRGNRTVATVSRSTVLPMLAIGIIDKVNLIVAAPYVQTKSSEPNGGRFAGANGFQDLGVALKAEIINQPIGAGQLAFLTTLGFSTPMTNYLSDYGPYSLGFGAPEYSLRGILQYKTDKGIYVRGALAHLWRGQTQAERDYYYNNGSYYTSWMDVPNAWNYHGAAGIWLLDNSLKMEATYMGLKSTSGDDIRAYNAGQPTNKVELDQIGFAAQYYFKKIKGFGLLGYYAQIINGRNMGKFRNLGAGVTYQFSI
jgi:hypothetical protein